MVSVLCSLFELVEFSFGLCVMFCLNLSVFILFGLVKDRANNVSKVIGGIEIMLFTLDVVEMVVRLVKMKADMYVICIKVVIFVAM